MKMELCSRFARYVLKRVIRRAVRYTSEKLHGPPGLLASLVPVVVDSLVSQYCGGIISVTDSYNKNHGEIIKCGRNVVCFDREIHTQN